MTRQLLDQQTGGAPDRARSSMPPVSRPSPRRSRRRRRRQSRRAGARAARSPGGARRAPAPACARGRADESAVISPRACSVSPPPPRARPRDRGPSRGASAARAPRADGHKTRRRAELGGVVADVAFDLGARTIEAVPDLGRFVGQLLDSTSDTCARGVRPARDVGADLLGEQQERAPERVGHSRALEAGVERDGRRAARERFLDARGADAEAFGSRGDEVGALARALDERALSGDRGGDALGRGRSTSSSACTACSCAAQIAASSTAPPVVRPAPATPAVRRSTTSIQRRRRGALKEPSRWRCRRARGLPRWPTRRLGRARARRARAPRCRARRPRRRPSSRRRRSRRSCRR